MQNDIFSISTRLKGVLPSGWFGSSTPILDALLNSLASCWETLFSLLNYCRNQTRLVSATDYWLDLIAKDFAGEALARRNGEQDNAFRNRISANLLKDRGTRS